MNVNASTVLSLKNRLESIIEELRNVPEKQRQKAGEAIEMCLDCLKGIPSIQTPVYIHITGTDKSFKTSYLLDLFDNEALRNLFALKVRNTSENTAVPCLIEPSPDVDTIRVRQISISTKTPIREDLTKKQFMRLYDLASGATPDDYLIQILIPADATPMKIPVIEYPGIKEGADALEAQHELHQIFQKNMLMTLSKYPGILVACFQHKIAIPLGHPMDAILKRYGEVLRTNYAHHKLPLIISMQGESAIASYCGNTNVEKDLKNDFKSHIAFDTIIQLVNPCNLEYPVSFSPPGPFVDSWIKHYSRYESVEDIKEQILIDGGISRSRQMIETLCRSDHLQEALDNIFLRPWIMEAESCLGRAVECHNELATYDEVAEVSKKIRKAVLNNTYRPLRYFFNHEMEILPDRIIEDHPGFWRSIFSQYLGQFLEDHAKSTAVSSVLWENLASRLDSENKGFLGTREEDLPYIIMNVAELYVPNALIRGDYAIIGKTLED